ncbi:GGDEF domain-containing protein [Kangiella sediminilitoris]|uniref:diguanylate cyclase n=1 Tax=Kangiella sediminilitoris TaxID=1144748 RepID=A0A1B3BBN0_9GAMM|nr:GGDEF domain-containing protein [Kangiella sediminilitoris]AOE50196.1 Diguanylate cyclase [Kangiella sediminilitoris]
MKRIIQKVGRIRLVIIITLVAALLAIGLNILLQLIQGNELSYTALYRALISAIIIAPLLSWYLVGLFMRVIELEQKMQEWAMFDQLTGLFNRRAFLHRAEQEYTLAKRHNESFAILVLDLDHFKTINDKYGHKAGDLILEDFGQLIKSQVRQSDICGRIGGEEFGFILPRTDLNNSRLFAEKLLTTIEQRSISIEGKEIKYTASIGITLSHPYSNYKINNLLHQADRALYKAKSAGRNCYQVANAVS